MAGVPNAARQSTRSLVINSSRTRGLRPGVGLFVQQLLCWEQGKLRQACVWLQLALPQGHVPAPPRPAQMAAAADNQQTICSHILGCACRHGTRESCSYSLLLRLHTSHRVADLDFLSLLCVQVGRDCFLNMPMTVTPRTRGPHCFLSERQASVELFYRLNHARQTVDFVKRQVGYRSAFYGLRPASSKQGRQEPVPHCLLRNHCPMQRAWMQLLQGCP